MSDRSIRESSNFGDAATFVGRELPIDRRSMLAGLVVTASPMPALTRAVPQGEMMTRIDDTADEIQIRGLIDRWLHSFQSKSADAFMAIHSPAIVSFDIVPPLRYVGSDEYRTAFDALAVFDGPIDMELRDLNLTIGNNIAFSYSLNRFMGTMSDGTKIDYWFRWTTCFQKTQGQWLIVHDHTSLPTDFASGKAVQNLHP